MKKTVILLSFIIGALILTTAVSAAVLSPGLEVISGENGMTVSALKGETVSFSKAQFADATGAEEYDKLTISSLPEKGEGVLYFGDVAVAKDQVIKAKDISKLRFEPEADTESSSFDFVFDGAYTLTCNLVFTTKNNSAPTVFKTPVLPVFSSDVLKGEMRAHDVDGDSLYFEVVDYPEGGEIRFDSKTGAFTYTAGSRPMEDSFTYRVKDSKGNVSKEAELCIDITAGDSTDIFKDMKKGGYAAQAAAMTDKGYMTYVNDKGERYFSPDSQVSRLEFLVTCMNVFGADKLPAVEKTGFSDDGDIPEKYKNYVYSAAKLGIVSSESNAFRPNDGISAAEASVILNNIIGYEAKTVKDMEGVPAWADSSVSAMYELGVYDTEGGSAVSTDVMTKDSVAAMLSRVKTLLGE